VEPAELVGGVVEVGHAPAHPEVAGVRPRRDRPDRDHEAQPVGRGHLAAAPRLGQGKGGVVVDQAGVGGHQRVDPQIVLGHPREPSPREGGDVGAGERFEADVGGLCHQHRAHAEVQVLDPGGRLRDVGELVGEAGPGRDLGEQVGQVDRRQERSDAVSKREEGLGLVEAVERRELHLPAVQLRRGHSSSMYPVHRLLFYRDRKVAVVDLGGIGAGAISELLSGREIRAGRLWPDATDWLALSDR
jgi:hypothetical protein